MLPTDRVYQGLLAMLVGRCCLITKTLWTPVTLAGALALGVLNNQKDHYLEGILAKKQVYRFDHKQRLTDLDVHTTMVSVYSDVVAQLDEITTVLTDKANSSVGLSRTSVLIAMFAWSADLPNSDLILLLAPKMDLRVQKRAKGLVGN